jgi:hypothetical protein
MGAAILLATVTGVAASVSVDYDHNVDFTRFKTFAFRFSDEQRTLEKNAPLLHQDILAAITRNLEAGGLQKVDADPDLYLTYRVTAEKGATLDLNSPGLGTGPGWGPGWDWTTEGWGISNDTIMTFGKQSLIIDAVSARTKKAVWRGAGQAILPKKPKDAGKAGEIVIDWVDKMFEKFAKQHEQELKARGKKD